MANSSAIQKPLSTQIPINAISAVIMPRPSTPIASLEMTLSMFSANQLPSEATPELKRDHHELRRRVKV